MLDRGSYNFYRQDTGGLVVQVVDSLAAERWWLRFTIPAEGNTVMSVYEVRDRHLVAVSERTLRPIADPANPWTEIARQEYDGAALYLPAEIAEGDGGVLRSAGLWSWSDNEGAKAAGEWLYEVGYSFLLGRLHVAEKWTEWNALGHCAQFHRTEVFDARGFQGFDDALVTAWNGVVCRKEWIR